MRIGTIIEAHLNEQARKPAYILHIDFGPLGIRKSSAQITKCYTTEELIGRQVIAVVNFPPKQIASMMSECLVLGGLEEQNQVILLQPERKVTNGTKIA